jgi:hypothetical protein
VQQEKEGLGLYDLAKVLISPLFSSFSFSNQEKKCFHADVRTWH